jgi:protein-S-isoprenylcysteine O-methyltransferase Ste14
VLVLPNWVGGPSYLVTFGILFALVEFGADYAEYVARTKRLMPGIW